MFKLRVFLVLVCTISVQSDTIKQLLDSDIPELSTLRSYLANMKVNLYRNMFASNDGLQFTFFAPNNAAFSKLPKGQRDLYNSASQGAVYDFNKMLKYHTGLPTTGGQGSTALRLSQFKDYTQTYGNQAGRFLFYVKKGQTYYVNGARIIKGDIEASNGIIHIVDTIMYHMAMPNTIYDTLGGEMGQSTKVPRPKFSKFMQLLGAYEQQDVGATTCLTNPLSKATVFAPTDDAFVNINTIRMNQLLGSRSQLKKVVDSHVICSDVYFTNMLYDQLSGSGIDAYSGIIRPKLFLNDLYISNGCIKAMILKASANMTMQNGVIQPIDRVLGYFYNSLLEELASRNDVRDFNRYAQGSSTMRNKLSWEELPTLEVPENEKYTLFVPQDSKYVTDISQNMNLDNILLSHMLPGEVDLEELISKTRFTTLGKKEEGYNDPAVLVVHSELNDRGEKEYYVSVNNVGGKIIKSDICVRNGIIHIVDSLLAMPSQSPMQFLEDDANLNTFLREVQFMNHFLEDRHKTLTIFAPTDRAFAEMRKSRIGNMLLGFNYRIAFRRMLNRHIIIGQAVLLSEAKLPMDNIQTEFDKISLRKVGSTYKVLFNNNQNEVNIIKADNRITNGVIHVIDEVMFIDDLNAQEIVGAAMKTESSYGALLAVIIITFLLSNNTL